MKTAAEICYLTESRYSVNRSKSTKNPSLAGGLRHPRIFLDMLMVEAAGIEPNGTYEFVSNAVPAGLMLKTASINASRWILWFSEYLPLRGVSETY